MCNFTLKIICLLNLKYIATFSKHLLLMSLMIISLLMKYLYFSHRNLVDPFGILRILKLHYKVLRYRYFFPFILFDTWCDSFQFGTYAVFQFRGKISVKFFWILFSCLFSLFPLEIFQGQISCPLDMSVISLNFYIYISALCCVSLPPLFSPPSMKNLPVLC